MAFVILTAAYLEAACKVYDYLTQINPFIRVATNRTMPSVGEKTQLTRLYQILWSLTAAGSSLACVIQFASKKTIPGRVYPDFEILPLLGIP